MPCHAPRYARAVPHPHDPVSLHGQHAVDPVSRHAHVLTPKVGVLLPQCDVLVQVQAAAGAQEHHGLAQGGIVQGAAARGGSGAGGSGSWGGSLRVQGLAYEFRAWLMSSGPSL